MISTMLDKMLGANPEEGLELLWRRRAIMLVAFSYGMIAAILCVLKVWVGDFGPSTYFCAATILSYAVAPVMIARGHSPMAAGLHLMIVSLINTGIFVYLAGGILGQGSLFLVGGPLAAALLLGLRGVLISSAIGLLMIAGFYVFEQRIQGADISTMQVTLRCLSLIVFSLFSYSTVAMSRQMLSQADDARHAADVANRAKTDFLANISHEIRTPLNGVVAMAESMSFDDVAEGQREKLAVIRESGALLLRVINDVLDVSKIEAGGMTLEKRVFDLGHVAQMIRDLYSLPAEAKGLSFEMTVAEDLHGVRIGDEHRVVQIIGNLVGNAIKFTSEGSVRVEIGAGPIGVRISVLDTGLGMTALQAQSVMRPFVQADSSTTRLFGGTGLGLSIVNGLAHAMHGSVDIETAPGRGSAFHVDLPLARASKLDPMPASPGSGEGAVDIPDFSQLRLLVVDDNAVNIRVLKALLLPTKAKVVEAMSGAEGIELAAAEQFDLILMDISMPEIDGIEASDRIRNESRYNHSTPIIAVTAHALDHETAVFQQYGFDAILGKPISAARLYGTIASCVQPARRAAAGGVSGAC